MGAALGAEHEVCSQKWVFPSKTGKWCSAWYNVGDCLVGKELPWFAPGPSCPQSLEEGNESVFTGSAFCPLHPVPTSQEWGTQGDGLSLVPLISSK